MFSVKQRPLISKKRKKRCLTGVELDLSCATIIKIFDFYYCCTTQILEKNFVFFQFYYVRLLLARFTEAWFCGFATKLGSAY